MLIIGAIFKLQHWPGASILIVLGSFLLAAIYLPVFAMVSMRDTRKREKKVNKTLYVAGVMTGNMLELDNTLVLSTASMDSTLLPVSLEQVNFIHKQTEVLDNYLQEIMLDIKGELLKELL